MNGALIFLCHLRLNRRTQNAFTNALNRSKRRLRELPYGFSDKTERRHFIKMAISSASMWPMLATPTPTRRDRLRLSCLLQLAARLM